MALKATIDNTTFHVGDTVGVHYKLIEKEKEAGRTKREVVEKTRERTQIFEGIVIAIRGSQENKTFTVRKIASGEIGVERIFPLISPWIKEITVKKRAKVRRSKLYYLRDRVGKKAFKLKEIKETPKKKAKRVKKAKKGKKAKEKSKENLRQND